MTYTLFAVVGCGGTTEKRFHSDVPITFTTMNATYAPALPWKWEALPQDLDSPRNLMSEQEMDAETMVKTVAPIASPYVYVLEGQIESAAPAKVEVRLATEYAGLEQSLQHRILRVVPAVDGQFQITFNTYPSENIIQLMVQSSASAYLHRAELRMARDDLDLRTLGGLRGDAEKPGLHPLRRNLSLDGEIKKSLLFPGSASAAFPLTIPKDAIVHTYYAVLAGNGFRSTATFRLDFIADGVKETRRLCSMQLMAESRAQIGHWQSMVCDLKDLPGKRGHLVFRTEAGVGEKPLFLWGAPTLFVRGKPRPNLLVITLDSLSSERMTSAPGARDPTPFLSQLAREVVFFPHFITNSSMSQGSLLSMVHSQENVRGIVAQEPELVGKSTHLMQHLRSHGYLTETLGDFPETTSPGNNVEALSVGDLPSSDRSLLNQTRILLRSRQDAQQAIWLHLQGLSGSAHLGKHPIMLLSVERERLILDYDRRLQQIDDDLRRFFEEAQSERLLDNTLIVLTANHGIDLFAHNPLRSGHGVLFDTVIRVPLFWIEPRRSGARPAKRIELPVGAIDLAPSIMEYLGITPPIDFQGKSFLPQMDGIVALRQFHLSVQPCTTQGWIYSLRSARYKFIHTPSDCPVEDPDGYSYALKGELYDLLIDPQESQNLFDRDPELVMFFKRHLADRLRKSHFLPGPAHTYNERLNEVRRMAGYVP